MLAELLQPVLSRIDDLTGKMAALEGISKSRTEKYPETQYLRSVHGAGALIALTLYSRSKTPFPHSNRSSCTSASSRSFFVPDGYIACRSNWPLVKHRDRLQVETGYPANA